MKKVFTLTMAFIISISYLAMAAPLSAAPGELVVNGGFELPVVTDNALWDIFPDGTVNLGWSVEWMPSAVSGGATDPANLELHRGVNSWLPQEGEQYAELDTDWDGPSGSINGEAASVKIYQDLTTCTCHDYELSFWFSPRPGTVATNNVLEVWWDGEFVESITQDGNGNTEWTEFNHTLHASSDTTRLEFRDSGTADSLGTFLDNVSVIGELDCGQECCDEPIVVINKNRAIVGNHVSAGANTGGNYAGGADGGDGGDGGDIRNRGDDVEDSTTGNGGAGGNAGEDSGGLVVTGNAGATAGAINVVNTNVTRIGADDEEEDCCPAGFTLVKNRNRAIVLNGVDAGANSGDNAAKGADGGEGGEGGDIKNKDGGDDVDNSHTGDGGTGGTSGEGGVVLTGDAGSTAGVINIVNRNRLRIR